VFAQKALNGVGDGLLYGNPGQLAVQGAAVLAAILYSGLASFVLLKVINLVLPLRADGADEIDGLDITQHGEEAYVHAEGNAAMVAVETAEDPSAVTGVLATSR
jgi:ammonium transporter, Amt family